MSNVSDPNVECARVAIRDALGCTEDPEVRRYLGEALHLLDRVDENADTDDYSDASADENADCHGDAHADENADTSGDTNADEVVEAVSGVDTRQLFSPDRTDYLQN